METLKRAVSGLLLAGAMSLAPAAMAQPDTTPVPQGSVVVCINGACIIIVW